MKIGEAFKVRFNEYLQKNNLSVFSFSKQSGIARSTIINLCIGNSKSPTLETLYEICDALNITVLEFLDCELFQMENIDLD